MDNDKNTLRSNALHELWRIERCRDHRVYERSAKERRLGSLMRMWETASSLYS